ncbi:MAG: MobC family plasmid mobilization relaxosome protein [Alteromonas sp.]|nr:MobC family plasmid mobilization relaxosome protein [Alteromonas sp.]
MRANTKIDKPNRDKVLPPCRVTTAELSSFKKKAKAVGLSLSSFQRQALNNAAVIVREPLVDVQLVSQLSAIGNNLNQLVRNEHIHSEADTVYMRQILKALDTIIMGVVSDPKG